MQKKKKVELQKPKMSKEYLDASCLFDDAFVNECFKHDPGNMQHVLRIITESPQLDLSNVEVQKPFENPHGHAMRADGYAESTDEELFVLEVQRVGTVSSGRKKRRFTLDELYSRALHELYLLGAHAVRQNESYERQRKHTVVYILDDNILGEDVPIVEFNVAAAHNPDLRISKGRILFVNGAYRDESTELGRLMHDFAQSDPDKMHHGPLKDTATYFKRTREGRAKMVGTATDMLEAMAEDLAQEIAVEMAAEMAEEMAEVRAQQMAQNMAQQMAQSIAQQMAQNMAQQMAQNMAQQMAQNMAARMAAERVAREEQRIRALTILEDYFAAPGDADTNAALEHLCTRIKGLSREDAEAYVKAYNNGERLS